MSYIDIKDGLLALLRDVPGFDIENVTYEDYQPLNAGKNVALIVKYAGFTREANAFAGEEWRDWRFMLELFVPFTDIVAARAAEDTNRQLILDRLYNYPMLNGVEGVFDTWVTSSQPSSDAHELGDGKWTKELIDFTVREDLSGPTQE